MDALILNAVLLIVHVLLGGLRDVMHTKFFPSYETSDDEWWKVVSTPPYLHCFVRQ